MLSVGHPHNFALQIWTELGAIGIAVAISMIILVLRAVASQPHNNKIASLTLTAVAGVVGSVGHGAWQGWWGASLGAAAIWILGASRTRPKLTP